MSHLRRSAYLLASLAAAAFAVSVLWNPAPPQQYTGLGKVRIPEAVADFRSRGDDPVSEQVRAALSAADLVSRTYTNGNGQSLQFTMIGGTDRSALHDPRSCLLGAGWRIEDERTQTIPGTGVSAQVCRIVRDSTQDAYEVVYLYVVNKEIVTQVTQIRFQMLLSALIGRRGTPTVFVRFMRPVQKDDETDAASRAQFLAFAGQMWNTLRGEMLSAGNGS